MVPPEMRTQPHVSFTQLDQYLRCPLKYRFTYVDRLRPDFVPAALAFGSGIHGAAAFLFRGRTDGTQPSVADVQAYFEGYWKIETSNRPIRFGEKDTKESLLDLACRMLEVLHKNQEPGVEIVGVEQPFDVPLVDLDTGELLDRAGRHTRSHRARRPGAHRGRGSQDVGAQVHRPPGRGVAPVVRL
jgi:putative RecB family exonuclease